MNKIILNENQLNRLFEYHAQQRLPFDDEFYGKKNQAEHYLDWLEEFGKYGKIGGSNLDLQTSVEEGVKNAIIKGRINAFVYDIYDDYDDDEYGYDDELMDEKIDEISNYLMLNKFKYFKYDDRGNIYIERAIKLEKDISNTDNDLFFDLTKTYQNNVGGCWAFKPGMGYAYCSMADGASLLLKGWIRLEDIDWLKTCDLNYNQDEYEIRVKPNTKVELFEVLVNGYYKLPLYDTLVVTSTYFGNREGYNGDYATVDDGMGGKQLINRDGEFLFGDDNEFNIYDTLEDYLFIIKNKEKKYNIYNAKQNNIILDVWYDYIYKSDIIYDFMVFKCGYNGKEYLIDINGNNLLNAGYTNIDDYNDYLKVEDDDEYYNIIILNKNNNEPLFDEWYYKINRINKIDNVNIFLVSVNGQHTLIDENNNHRSDWFDEIEEYSYSGKRTFYKVKLEGKCNILDSNGYKLLFDEWVSKILENNIIQKGKKLNAFSFSKSVLSPIWFDILIPTNGVFKGIEKGLRTYCGRANDTVYIFDENGYFYVIDENNNTNKVDGVMPIN